MNKSFDYCNKCGKADDAAIIHCAVCSYTYHTKCVAPKLTIKACDDLISSNNFQFYCDEHQNLCVHKLLNRISLLERKFRVCLEPLSDINNALEKHQADLAESLYNKSPIPVRSLVSPMAPPKRSLRSNRKPLKEVIPEVPTKKSKVSKNMNKEAVASIIPIVEEEIINGPFINPSCSTTSTSNDLEAELVAIAPEKKVFLSNLPSKATVKAIENHLLRKIPMFTISCIEVEKLVIKNDRNYSSFVINAKENLELFNTIVDEKLWPPYSIVHEFKNKSRKQNFQKLQRYQRRK